MPHARAAIEDHGPGLRLLGNRPQRVATGFEGVTVDRDVFAERTRGGRIGAGMPAPAPAHQNSKQLPAPRHGPIVRDRDIGRADSLIHRAMLTPGDLTR